MRMRGLWLGVVIWALGPGMGAGQEIAGIERQVPPVGVVLDAEVQGRLESEVAAFEGVLQGREQEEGYADVAVFAKALRFALRNGEFFKPKDVVIAEAVLAAGRERFGEWEKGKRPWMKKSGVTVGGYRSSIDGSLQPYGLEIPEGLDLSKPVRLYVWLHGRGDTKTDLYFVHERLTKPGKFDFEDGIVLHPFGRQCIGWKSAGETDVFEAIADVGKRFEIDEDRVALMGFSMGGAGAWHLGAHYADKWAVMHAGAGFAETARYQNIAKEDYPVWYEQKLWGLYDVPGYVRNLFNLPVMVYSGEEDKQMQAALVMEEAYAAQGEKLPHVIGPGMGHKYDPDSQATVKAFVEAAMDKGRDRWPRKVSLQTRTLRYPRMHWLEIHGLTEHWKNSRVDAELVPDGKMVIRTENVSRLLLHSPWEDGRPFPGGFEFRIDGEEFVLAAAEGPLLLGRNEGRWGKLKTIEPVVKRPGMQGPIDDVFMEPFLVVLPSGVSGIAAVDRWVEFESRRFVKRWRELFRGELRVVADTEVRDGDLERYHLVLWGTPESNRLMKNMMAFASGDWPGWTDSVITAGDRSFSAANHVLAMIRPNPVMGHRYIVFNSGPTFREAHDRTNSLQNPKLPDWAVINLDRPPDAEAPGEVVVADFFDENWRLRRR